MPIRRSISKFRDDGAREFYKSFMHVTREKLEPHLLSRPFGMSVLDAHATITPGFTDAPIFKTIWVDPDRIRRISEFRPRRYYGYIAGGDWDVDTKSFDEHPAYKATSDLLLNDETEALAKHFQRQVKRTPSRSWGYTGEDDIDERIADLDSLHKSIIENGYKSQKELMEGNEKRVRSKNNEPVPAELNEITVDIGRDGELLFCGFGAHRLSIAKIESAESVPVKVGTRHEEWQNRRDDIRNDRAQDNSPHPDLNDLIDK